MRLVYVFLLSLVVAFAIGEIGIRLQKENTARAPKTIELVIPPGTAIEVESGNEAAGIPKEMTFVLGDILLVRNLDEVAHTLGPLLIPPNSSAKMPLDEAENIAVTCSFSPSQYLGLDVRIPTTLVTRLTALSFSVPPTTVLLFFYSLAAFPIGSGIKDKGKPLSSSKK
jgi:hypothetical protein